MPYFQCIVSGPECEAERTALVEASCD